MALTMSSPRALYVHVPFCRRLCGYCDFYSEVLQPTAVDPLVDALLTELDRAAAPRPLSFDTIFVGGGTPTVLPPTALDRLLRGLREYADPTPDFEFTVEANPATVTDEVGAVLATAGVNRVSVGAQSFVPAELHALDRTHRPEQVAQTLATCRRHGINRLSLDLIFGIPGQTRASWLESLQAAINLGPEHLSCYGLTYEPGTPLFARREAGAVEPMDPDLEADLYEALLDRLPAHALPQYEISNFARPGAECRHNLRYWHNEPYLGIGPAAAGFVDDVRYKNIADTAAYVRALTGGPDWRPARRLGWRRDDLQRAMTPASPPAQPTGATADSIRIEEERLPPDRRMRETAMLELRLVEGIDRRRFAERYGHDPALLFADAIRQHAAAVLLVADDRSIRLTRPGLLLADIVIADFL
jgi:oxygen-independent coproporphyrinogen III oxidase